MKWGESAPPTPAQKGGVGVLLAVLLLLLAVLVPPGAHGQERYTPTSRGELRAIAYERAAVHGASGYVVWTVVSECEVRSLNPWALGDDDTSHGLAQLNERRDTGNLLGHFYSLGYTSPYSPWQAFDYLARAFAGEFLNARWGRIGPHRWSCYRLLFGDGL